MSCKYLKIENLITADSNIQLVQDNGNTSSQTNQVFDQQKVKEDKRNMRTLLDLSRTYEYS